MVCVWHLCGYKELIYCLKEVTFVADPVSYVVFKALSHCKVLHKMSKHVIAEVR